MEKKKIICKVCQELIRVTGSNAVCAECFKNPNRKIIEENIENEIKKLNRRHGFVEHFDYGSFCISHLEFRDKLYWLEGYTNHQVRKREIAIEVCEAFGIDIIMLEYLEPQKINRRYSWKLNKDGRIIDKVNKECKYHKKGICKYGENCIYEHLKYPLFNLNR